MTLLVCAVFACANDSGVTDPIDEPDPPGEEPPPPPPPPPPVPIVIGASGGTVAMASATATLVVPPGALAVDLPITVQTLAVIPPDSNVVAPSAHRFEPGAQLLAAAATLHLPYEVAALGDRPLAALRIARWNGAAWEPQVAGQVVDSVTRVVSSSVTALGDFAIVRNPCVPATVSIGSPIPGVTTRTDCPAPTGPPFNDTRFNDYYDFTLVEQTVLTLGIEATFYAVAGIQHHDADPSAAELVTRLFLPSHIPSGPQRTLRAILAPGRYQFLIGEYALGPGGPYTLLPAAGMVADVVGGFPCGDRGVALTPGVTVAASVTTADCAQALQPGFTNDYGAYGATSYGQAFTVNLRAGDSTTVTLSGNTSIANVGLVVNIGPGAMIYLDAPDEVTRSITLTATVPTSIPIWVKVHGRATNAYAFPGPTMYILTLSP